MFLKLYSYIFGVFLLRLQINRCRRILADLDSGESRHCLILRLERLYLFLKAGLYLLRYQLPFQKYRCHLIALLKVTDYLEMTSSHFSITSSRNFGISSPRGASVLWILLIYSMSFI